MPISVTSHGDIRDAVQFVKDGAVLGMLPKPVQRFAGEAIRGFRDVKALTSANPVTYAVNELMFPDPVASGTMTDVLNRLGPDAVNRTPSATYDPTL